MKTLAFTYKGQTFPVKHQVQRRYRRIHLHIKPDHLLVKSPGLARKELVAFLESHGEWIVGRWHEQHDARARLPERALVEGRSREIIYMDTLTAPFYVDSKVYLPSARDAGEAVALLREVYTQQARSYLPARLRHWSERMDLYPQAVRLKWLKSRWGSCSARGNINLNVRVMQLSRAAIDSVLIHELAHLRHLDHGPQFWALVHCFCPDYSYHHQSIQDLGGQLI